MFKYCKKRNRERRIETNFRNCKMQLHRVVYMMGNIILLYSAKLLLNCMHSAKLGQVMITLLNR